MPVTDFDFLPGTWRVRNRKLTDALDPACDRWEEFDATSEAHADARRGRERRPLPRALAGLRRLLAAAL